MAFFSVVFLAAFMWVGIGIMILLFIGTFITDISQ